jgi:hypothetical protein
MKFLNNETLLHVLSPISSGIYFPLKQTNENLQISSFKSPRNLNLNSFMPNPTDGLGTPTNSQMPYFIRIITDKESKGVDIILAH